MEMWRWFTHWQELRLEDLGKHMMNTHQFLDSVKEVDDDRLMGLDKDVSDISLGP